LFPTVVVENLSVPQQWLRQTYVPRVLLLVERRISLLFEPTKTVRVGSCAIRELPHFGCLFTHSSIHFFANFPPWVIKVSPETGFSTGIYFQMGVAPVYQRLVRPSKKTCHLSGHGKLHTGRAPKFQILLLLLLPIPLYRNVNTKTRVFSRKTSSSNVQGNIRICILSILLSKNKNRSP
jgi:hypothetical protein